MGKYLSEQDKQFIIDNFNNMTLVDIAKHLDRRSDFIGGWARKLGLRKLKMVPWTKEEEQVIKDNFPKWGADKCVALLNNTRTREQVHWKAKRLGIYCDMTQQRINLGIKHNNFEKNKSYGICGYIIVNINGHVRTEQDLIAEKILVRKLASNEIVHHINEIKDDNRPENLSVLTRSDHIKYHRGDTSIKIVPLSELDKR